LKVQATDEGVPLTRIKRRIAVLAVSVSLVVPALLVGPITAAQADHNPLHTVICLVRSIPILPPPGCSQRDGTAD
jgi:hypothetical protein